MTIHPKWIIKFIHKSKIQAVKIVNWEDHHEVCTIPNVYEWNGKKSDGAQAAALISTAPELLEQLEFMEAIMNSPSIRRAVEKYHSQAYYQAMQQMNRQAISKAKGE